MASRQDDHLNMLMTRAAERASRRAFFMASALADFRKIEGIDEQQLAHHLGCSQEQLTRLALCRRPESSSSTFLQDVGQIGRKIGINTGRILSLLRHVDALGAASQHVLRGGVFMAARDGDDDLTANTLDQKEIPPEESDD